MAYSYASGGFLVFQSVLPATRLRAQACNLRRLATYIPEKSPCVVRSGLTCTASHPSVVLDDDGAVVHMHLLVAASARC